MPYLMKKVNGKFCVFNKTTNENKGCSDTREKGIAHMRALYAAEGKTFSEIDALIAVKGFSDVVAADGPVWVQAFPYGHWPHPNYTDTTINRDRAERLVKNFHDNVRRQDIPTDYEHGQDKAKGSKASGWIKDAAIRDDGVWIAVDFTPTARDEIAKGEWKYFSAMMLDVWQDPETDETFEDVLIGGGLTNLPWMKGRVPLNFSEVAVVEDVAGLRYKSDGDSPVEVSEDKGASWRPATKNEVVEWEHSEPGTGPQPKLDEDDRSGDKDGSGSRRDTPPPEPDRPLNSNEEGSIMNREQMLAFARAIGIKIDDSWTDDQLNAKVEEQGKKLFSESEELATLRAEQHEAKSFAERFPEQAKELENLRTRDNEFQAKVFSENYTRVTKKNGEEVTRLSRGLSGLALQKVQEFGQAVIQGEADIKMFSEFMDVMNSDGAFVDYKEAGSQRTDEHELDIPTERLEIAKQFSEKVEEVKNKALEDNKVMTHGDAVMAAAKAHPDLWKAYNEAPTPTA